LSTHIKRELPILVTNRNDSHLSPTPLINKIKKSLDYNYPIGNDRFKQQIENALGRAVGHNRRGRPNDTLKIG